MCGRFTITVPYEELLLRYYIDEDTNINYEPSYNAAPMQYIPAVVKGSNGNRLGSLRWGLIPSWAKDDKIASKMINARAETITEKPSFNRLIASRRCIIPADGFYEWQQRAKSKQPFRIILKDEGFSLSRGFTICGWIKRKQTGDLHHHHYYAESSNGRYS